MKLENYSDDELRRELKKRERSEPYNQWWRMQGVAWGNAFTARMCGDYPGRTEDAKEAYRWAEKEFLRIAQDKITIDDAVVGFGG
jgi:hypothetical protein